MKKGEKFNISGFENDHKYQLQCEMIKDEPDETPINRLCFIRYGKRRFYCTFKCTSTMHTNINHFMRVNNIIKIM